MTEFYASRGLSRLVELRHELGLEGPFYILDPAGIVFTIALILGAIGFVLWALFSKKKS